MKNYLKKIIYLVSFQLQFISSNNNYLISFDKNQLTLFSHEKNVSPLFSEDKDIEKIKTSFWNALFRDFSYRNNGLLIDIQSDSKEVNVYPLTEIPLTYKKIYELTKTPEQSLEKFFEEFMNQINNFNCLTK